MMSLSEMTTNGENRYMVTRRNCATGSAGQGNQKYHEQNYMDNLLAEIE